MAWNIFKRSNKSQMSHFETDDSGNLYVVLQNGETIAISNAGLTELAAAISATDAEVPSSAILVSGDDGTNSVPLQMDGSGNLKVNATANIGAVNTDAINSVVGAIVTTASSPTTWGGTWEDSYSVNTTLSRNGTRGYIACDGPGTLRVGISSDGIVMATNAVIEIKPGEVIDLTNVGVTINTVKIDADTHLTYYRLLVS